MNLKKLKYAEEMFLSRYPGGFEDPEIQAIVKKHKLDKMSALSHEYFSKANFKDHDQMIIHIMKIVTASSMVSVFEKVKFKDFIYELDETGRIELVRGLKDMLHGDQRKGFEAMVEVLKTGKMAKWPILTVIPNYYYSTKEVFIKPTTVKGVISQFELKNLKYDPKPSWEFYEKYRTAINEMKSKVDTSLTENNAGFCGFLMSSLN